MESALIAFDNNLYAQSAENLINSISFQSSKGTFTDYYEHSLLDSNKIEYLLPAFESQSANLDTLNNGSYFFISIMHLNKKDYIYSLDKAKKYINNFPNDTKGYELI